MTMEQNKTECEWMDDFINSNSDIALKYIMWKDMQLEPQVFTNGNIDAEETDCEVINLNIDEDGFIN